MPFAVDEEKKNFNSDFEGLSTQTIYNNFAQTAQHAATAQNFSPTHLVERCVVVAKQHDGYGLTVTGEHPVYVNTIKADGAAYRAGVRQGDQILKVNGMPVTSSNTQEVLRMISGKCEINYWESLGGHNVALTLLGQSPNHDLFFGAALPSPLISAQYEYNTNNNRKNTTGSIKSHLAEPIFIESRENENDKECWRRQQRVWELYQMLKRERSNLENLREKSTQGGKVENVLKRITDLQNQLKGIDPSFDDRQGNAFLISATNLGTTTGSIVSGVGGKSKSKSISNSINIQSLAVDNNNKVDSLPVKSWVDSGGMHYLQSVDVMQDTAQTDFEDDDDNLGLIVEDPGGPFANLMDLKTRPAHLSIFFSYLLNNSNPSSLVNFLLNLLDILVILFDN